MKNKKKVQAIGELLFATTRLENIRGGKQKIQRILGENLFFKTGTEWYYNHPEIKKLTISQLNNLTNLINQA